MIRWFGKDGLVMKNGMDSTFRALRAFQNEEGRYVQQIQKLKLSELPEGEVLIQVDYSSLNYKDALSASGNPGVTKNYPHTPGIDAAGVVVESKVPEFDKGQKVLVTGYDLGMNTDGGYGECIRVPGKWVLPLPEGLTLFESMIFGTAGFTAAMCIDAIMASESDWSEAPVLVTGATGGVGSMAIGLLANLGIEVHAVTGKQDRVNWLKEMGATKVIGREELLQGKQKPMLKAVYGGVIDTVGGDYLSVGIKSTKYGCHVASCGLAASAELNTTVYPFILRGVSLLGIDSVHCPELKRKRIWEKLAGEWKLPGLESYARVVNLEDLPVEFSRILAGEQVGRVVVDLKP